MDFEITMNYTAIKSHSKIILNKICVVASRRNSYTVFQKKPLNHTVL